MRVHALYSVAAAAIMCLAMSCGKADGTDKIFRTTIEPAAESSKVTYNNSNGLLLWQAGDQISVSDAQSNTTVYGLASGVGTASAEYSYASGDALGAGPYTAVYPASIRTGAGTVSLPAVQHTPDGSLQGMPMYAVSNNMELKFYHLCGVVRFRLSASSAVSVSRIAVATNMATNGAAAISGCNSSVAISTPTGDNVTTLSCDIGQSIASPHDFYMCLPAGTYSTFRILMTAADGSTCLKSAASSIVVERGKITTITLSGLTFTEHRFRITSTPTEYLVFAPGNLQYIGSAEQPYWKFADRQYDYFGKNAQHLSSAENVDRDLFGWGTSGWNSGAGCYQPWSTYDGGAQSTFHYYPGGDMNNNLTGNYVNADWGVYNAIRNYGNTAGQWRTPSNYEWNKILFNRNGTRYAKAQIGGNRNGLILFPDDYSHPRGLRLDGTNSEYAAFTINTYSVADWFLMEAAGAVFLPASGYRMSTFVGVEELCGYYWSSTNRGLYDAYSMEFTNSNDFSDYSWRCYGLSVRLVRLIRG